MKNLLYTLSLLLLGMMTVSCGDDEPALPPVANFTVDLDGKTATFTNTSTSTSSDALTFAWEFGDGETSTDESPTHTFEKNGSFVAKLTVSNDAGSDDKQEVLEIINIKVDGDFSEWEDVDVAIGGANVSGTITSVKFENLENNKFYIYVEGTTELTHLTQILLDTDNDASTGANIDWFYLEGGEDILLEGNLVAGGTGDFEQSGAIYPCNLCVGQGGDVGVWDWGTPTNENIADFIVASELVSISGGLAYELVIDLTALGTTISSDGIRVGVNDVSLDSWGPVGFAPKHFEINDNPEGTMYSYSF